MDDAWDLIWLLGQIACTIAMIGGAVLAFFETDFMLERPAASLADADLTEADPHESVAPMDLHKAA